MTNLTRTTPMKVLGATMLLVALGAAEPRAQQQAVPERPAVIPAKVEVVISRSQGGRQTSSLPYSLMVNLNSPRSTSIRMGVDVPIGTTTTSREGSTSVTTTETKYRNVGTSIDCHGSSRPDGRYEVFVNVSDSSFATGGGTEPRPGSVNMSGPVAIQTFTTSNNLTLRENETVEFTMATDKVTGETVKIAVRLALIR